MTDKKKRGTDPSSEQSAFMREVREQARNTREERKRRREQAVLRAKREHDELFSRPLIAPNTLTKRERERVRERVRNCGQLNWRISGAAYS